MARGEWAKRPVVDLVLPDLWPHQREFVEDDHQFTVCKSATKCGKTLAAAWWLAREIARTPGGLFWWVGPTNEMGLVGYLTVAHLLEPIIVKRQERPWKFRTEGGATCALKTAQEPEFLRGAGVDGMVLDEAGTPDYDKAWPEIRTTITASRGRLKIIGNPGDAGQFMDRTEAWGLDPGMPEWSFRRWKFLDRPTARPSDLEQAKRELGEDSPEFRRYYLGETIQGAGAFFYGLDPVCVGQVEGPRPGRTYVVGVDPSGSHGYERSDWFVASVWDLEARRQVNLSRYKGPPTEQQEEEADRLGREYNDAVIAIEMNGPGAPIAQRLMRLGRNVLPFETTGKSKTEVLVEYRSDISHGLVTLLDDPYQKDEHLKYQRTVTPLGTVRYGAPAGGHDDTVMAAAIAAHGMRRTVIPMFLPIETGRNAWA